ncbi:pyrimidine dimer DNA glycosylase/endonuclease V [Thiovibrio frasassiensis]|uniref:Pyrimidine dimer DNA glycosylase/endonuclease V n=1 Tax=Thiovibrio frasassiensis TaxID=2984131 RepID=A0A9X4MKW0_9BACT|nr:pyrimidine dimer DNA glycosylase/endonuclease V [Thiovibrio frasassiensis]MDG4474707.1 pyrimidine dimer DNA glycosylase/endonuclease V [Thiovibrio frasassiensis]
MTSSDNKRLERDAVNLCGADAVKFIGRAPQAKRCGRNEMRLWSINPSYLDSKGLVALWREALLAKNVLEGKTVGYKNHPQLVRFKSTSNPVGAIASYLRAIAEEAESRGYNFDKSKIPNKRINSKIIVTSGQVDYEFNHLLNKLKFRDPGLHESMRGSKRIRVHPLFTKVRGNVENWEVI